MIVFVPSRKQAQLTAIELITYESQQDSTFLGHIEDEASLLRVANLFVTARVGRIAWHRSCRLGTSETAQMIALLRMPALET